MLALICWWGWATFPIEFAEFNVLVILGWELFLRLALGAANDVSAHASMEAQPQRIAFLSVRWHGATERHTPLCPSMLALIP